MFGFRVFPQVELDDSLEVIGKTSNTVQEIQWILRIKQKLLNQVVKLRKIALILYEFETLKPVILHLTKVVVEIEGIP